MKNMARLIRVLRKTVYMPLEACQHLPVGPLLYLWVARLTLRVDAPLRAYFLGGAHVAKSTE